MKNPFCFVSCTYAIAIALTFTFTTNAPATQEKSNRKEKQEKQEKEVLSCQHSPRSFHCVRYIKNYDGDTLTVHIPDLHPFFGQDMNVRLKGLDTPELKTKDKCELEKARIAKNFIQHFLKDAKRIDLVNVEREKYFRILAEVHVDGKNLGDLLLKNKLAVPYNGGTKNKVNWCQPLQRSLAAESPNPKGLR